MPATFDIIVVNDFAHLRGGGDRVAIASAIGLADAGRQVTFFSAVGPVDSELARHSGVNVICLGLTDILRDPNRMRAARDGAWNTSAAKLFRQTLSKCDPDTTIVHVHSFTKALSAAVPCAGAEMGFRTVLSLHDYFLLCPNGAYFEFPTMEVCTRRPLGRDCFSCRCDARNHTHKLWRFARTWWQNRVVDLPGKLDCVIAVSRTNFDTARGMLPPECRIELVSYPVDADPGTPVAVEENDTFLYVGRMELFKGPQILAEAAATLNAKVTFCGDGPAMEKVKAIYPAAEMAGWQHRSALPGYFNRARALVFTSLWPETFGLTAVEALARGVPVIASKGTAAEESVVHGVNGLLFERGSVESLAAMMQLVSDRILAAKLGREAHRRYWLDPLTMKKHVARLETIYTSVMSKIRLAA
jgi:glycosyltransferase involved in cell wall biosynthesis